MSTTQHVDSLITGASHFDRRETLETLLRNHRPPHPENVTAKVYETWDAEQRRVFDDARTERIARSIVVETPQLRQLNLEYRRAALLATRPIGRTGIILTGPPTMGKTTAAFQTMVQAFRRYEQRSPGGRTHGDVPVVYIEVPPQCNGKTLMGRFLHFFGMPVLARTTLEQRTIAVTELLVRCNVQLVVVDEMQNLLRATGQFEAAQALKNLMNCVKAVPLYVGIDLDKSALTNNELGAQFASRCSLIALDRVGLQSKADRQLWGGLIVGFEKQFALLNHPAGTLLSEAEYLWRRTRGSIAALSRLLTFAALDVIADGAAENEFIDRKQLASISLDLTTERSAAIIERGDTHGSRAA